MSLMQSIARLAAGVSATLGSQPGQYPLLPPITPDANEAITQYRVLKEMYSQVGMYEQLSTTLNSAGLWKEPLSALRNPANRVVEFYAAKLWSGANLEEALPIEGEQAVIDNVMQVWAWSNWSAQKQVAARWLAIYGDLFIKVIGKKDEQSSRVFFQLLEPETATEIDQDERGYLTYLRLDVPISERDANGKQVPFTITEVWDKSKDSFRRWKHEKGPRSAIDQLGTPIEDVGILETFGVNFIPVVQIKFRDTGDPRGSGSFAHAFDKITEANRMATRLHSLLFRHNNVNFAIMANGVDANMRPLPAPVIEGVAVAADPIELRFGDDRIWRLPGNSTLESLVPDLHYADALAILNAHMQELEHDLPELAYYRLRDLGSNLSGRAVRLLLSDAVDRVLEARGNAEAGLVRVDCMALTIANEIKALNTPGTFEEGSFDHSFKARPVIPTSDFEDAQASLTEAQAGALWETLGVSRGEILRQRGYSQNEIAAMEDENAKFTERFGSTMLDQFSRGNVAR